MTSFRCINTALSCLFTDYVETLVPVYSLTNPHLSFFPLLPASCHKSECRVLIRFVSNWMYSLFFLLNVFPPVFLFSASLGTCSCLNTKHLKEASFSLAKSLWRCNASSVGRRIGVSPSCKETQFYFQYPLRMHLRIAILDARWNQEFFLDHLNQISELPQWEGWKPEVQYEVTRVSVCLSLHRDGQESPNTHNYDFSSVSNKQNLKEEFFSRCLKNSEKMGDSTVKVTDWHS